MSHEAADTISVRCACGKKLKAPASAAGRKARCPKCGNVMTLEAPPQEEAYPLDEFADVAAGAAPAHSAPTALACPNCYQPMAEGAVLCTACGYDTRTGQTLATVSDVAPAPPPLPPRAAATGTRYVPSMKTSVEPVKQEPSGSLVKGVIFSSVLATIGAFIWFGIAKATHTEIGWIAWGIGVAAGFGMIAGYNGHSVHSGAVAAAIAVGGILLGKFMVFSWVVMPSAMGDIGNELDKLSDTEILQVFVANEQLEKQGIDPDTSTEAQDEIAMKQAEAVIAKMDAKTKAAKTAEAKAEFKQFVDQFVNDGNKMSLFGETMFSPIDIVFVVLALASAFKVATFAGEADN